MSTPARYVITTKDDHQQTFVLDGGTTLDDMFKHVADRMRGGSFADVAARMSGTYRVFSLSVSRDESAEPTAEERTEHLFSRSADARAHNA